MNNFQILEHLLKSMTFLKLANIGKNQARLKTLPRCVRTDGLLRCWLRKLEIIHPQKKERKLEIINRQKKNGSTEGVRVCSPSNARTRCSHYIAPM